MITEIAAITVGGISVLLALVTLFYVFASSRGSERTERTAIQDSLTGLKADLVLHATEAKLVNGKLANKIDEVGASGAKARLELSSQLKTTQVDVAFIKGVLHQQALEVAVAGERHD